MYMMRMFLGELYLKMKMAPSELSHDGRTGGEVHFGSGEQTKRAAPAEVAAPETDPTNNQKSLNRRCDIPRASPNRMRTKFLCAFRAGSTGSPFAFR